MVLDAVGFTLISVELVDNEKLVLELLVLVELVDHVLVVSVVVGFVLD